MLGKKRAFILGSISGDFVMGVGLRCVGNLMIQMPIAVQKSTRYRVL